MDAKTKELAEQAGMQFDDPYKTWTIFDDHIERFSELIRADEREACAKLCDEYSNYRSNNYADICAKAIRARINHDTNK
jgi:hypothetical protein